MKKTELALISLFSIKLFLDFLSPLREINFVIIFVIFLSIAIINVRKIFKISKNEATWLMSFSLVLIFALIQSGEVREFIKFSSLALIYLVTRSLIIDMSKESIERIAERTLSIFFILFIANYCISFALASPLDRAFFNFEHANLLGSYILVSLALLYSSQKYQSRISVKIKIFAAALLSTSTGASLLATTPFFKTKKINLKNIITLSAVALTAIITLYFILQAYLPIYFTKIFGPAILILEGNLDILSSLAKQGIRIQELGDEYQGSLMWRFYAYYIFTDFIGNQPFSSFIIGNGFHGYSGAWGGLMPHNDFILTLIDFGTIGLLLLSFAITKLLIYAAKRNPILLPFVIVLILRLLLENNIYSFYITSSLTMNGLLLFHAMRLKNKSTGRG